MSPLMMMLVAAGVFGVVFGGMLLASRALSRDQEMAVAEGPSGRPAPSVSLAEEKLSALDIRLKRAGIPMEGAAYQKRVRLFAAFGFVLGLVMGGFGFGAILFGLMLGVGALKGGDAYINWKHGKRLQEFIDQFCDALGVMGNGVKSGQTIMQTMESVAADFNNPLKGEVEEVLQELRMGVPMDEALTHWAERVPCEDLEIAVTALIVQRQTGGNVAEILDTLATTIRDRNKLQKQISSLTAQGRLSGIVMSLLPVGLFIAFYLISPSRTGLLLSHPLGLVLTAIGVMMVAVGSYVIKKIVTIEV